jgi:hypothetical protein
MDGKAGLVIQIDFDERSDGGGLFVVGDHTVDDTGQGSHHPVCKFIGGVKRIEVTHVFIVLETYDLIGLIVSANVSLMRGESYLNDVDDHMVSVGILYLRLFTVRWQF